MNAPRRMNSTPSVVLLEAAWERVYTSGSLISPIALKSVNAVPERMKPAAIHSLINSAFNDHTSFNESSKRNRSDEGKNP